MDIEKEKELILKILAGHPELYSHFIREYQDKLVAFVYRLTYNRADAEDIAQDAFIKAYQSLGSFRFKSRFSTWLYRIAWNNAMNSIKRNKMKSEKENQAGVPAYDTDHQKKVETEELQKIIATILGDIPEGYRAALHLFYNEEKSYFDISEIMQVPLNTVKSNIRRGKQIIREKLAQDHGITGLA